MASKHCIRGKGSLLKAKSWNNQKGYRAKTLSKKKKRTISFFSVRIPFLKWNYFRTCYEECKNFMFFSLMLLFMQLFCTHWLFPFNWKISLGIKWQQIWSEHRIRLRIIPMLPLKSPKNYVERNGRTDRFLTRKQAAYIDRDVIIPIQWNL